MAKLSAPTNFVYHKIQGLLTWDAVTDAKGYNIWVKLVNQSWPSNPVYSSTNSLPIPLTEATTDEAKGQTEAPDGEWGAITDPPESVTFVND